jgi:hypothetical protein
MWSADSDLELGSEFREELLLFPGELPGKIIG